MRTLLVVLAVLSPEGGTSVALTRPAEYAEARQAFTKAFQAGALDEARAALERRRAAAPGRIDLGGRFTDEGALQPEAPAARPRLLQLELR